MMRETFLRCAVLLALGMFLATSGNAQPPPAPQAAKLAKASKQAKAPLAGCTSASRCSRAGWRLTFLHKPGAGVQVEVNGTVKGLIKGDDFATAFLSIWLGHHPSNPNLKSGLLGGACE